MPGERTLAFGHRDRLHDPGHGYNQFLEQRMRALLPKCRQTGTRLITNMGVANPAKAAEITLGIARELGLAGLKIACIQGDNVTNLIKPDTALWEGGTVADVGSALVGANAYLGIDAIMPAFAADADVIITGRVADPSLFLAGIAHDYGWNLDDWQKLGAGTLCGHLLECGMQVTGGYFADPGRKEVPDLANCGYPIAEIDRSGKITISKLEGSGGLVSEATVKEQLLYEVHDPSAYVTPDVCADFSNVRIEAKSANVVEVYGAAGRSRPDLLKVTLGFDGGYLADAGRFLCGGERGRPRRAGTLNSK